MSHEIKVNDKVHISVTVRGVGSFVGLYWNDPKRNQRSRCRTLIETDSPDKGAEAILKKAMEVLPHNYQSYVGELLLSMQIKTCTRTNKMYLESSMEFPQKDYRDLYIFTERFCGVRIRVIDIIKLIKYAFCNSALIINEYRHKAVTQLKEQGRRAAA